MRDLIGKWGLRNLFERNKLAGSFGIYILGIFLIKGVSVITTPIFTRVLSTTGFGIVSIYQTWVSIFAVFIGLQMSGSVATARVHLPKSKFTAYVRSVLGLSGISFLGAVILFLCFSRTLAHLLQLAPKLIPYLVISAFGTTCSVFYLTYCIQAKQPKKHLFFSVITAVSTILLSLVLVLSFQENKYMGRIIGVAVTSVFIVGFVYKKLFFAVKTKILTADWKYALPLSLPLIVHLLSNLVIGQSDRLIINKFLGYDSAAIYSVAYTIGALGLMIAEATNNVWSPWYLDNTKAQKGKKVSTVSKYYILGLSFVFVSVMLTAPEILHLMAPPQYASGIGSLIVVTASIFFQFLYRFPLGYEQYSKNMKWVAVATVVAALLNLLLNCYFIPLWGMIGAAYATFISYVVLFFIHEIVARKIIKGYNIQFRNYIPGILIVMSIAIISRLIVSYPILRYSILILIMIAFLLYAYVIRKLDYIKDDIK